MLFEVASHLSMEDAENQANALIKDLEDHHFGYASPKLYGADIDKVNELRKQVLVCLAVL
jgi:hypothetical protein